MLGMSLGSQSKIRALVATPTNPLTAIATKAKLTLRRKGASLIILRIKGMLIRTLVRLDKTTPLTPVLTLIS
jgi:hypothetical protein